MRTFDGPSSDVTRDLSHTAEHTFNGIDYLISIFALKPETLEVEVEQKCDASRWKGEFSSKYIEEITIKTGSFKKFSVFVRMLLTALEQKSAAVTVDILTYNDVEQLRNSKTTPVRATKTHALVPNNKRYLILTYASEFDRVHYPLPLAFEDVPDPERLRRVICELRAEIESFRKTTDDKEIEDVQELMDTPSSIPSVAIPKKSTRRVEKRQERDFEPSFATRELRLVCKERDVLRTRLQEAQAELERERVGIRREMRKKNKEIGNMEKELERCTKELREEKTYSRELQRQIDALQCRTGDAVGRPGLPSGRRSKPLAPRSKQLNQRTNPYSHSHARDGESVGRTTKGPARRRASPVLSGYSTSGSGRSSKRSTASAKCRFDPTAYVREQQERRRSRELAKRTRPSSDRSSRVSSADSRASSRKTVRSGKGSMTASHSSSRAPSRQSSRHSKSAIRDGSIASTPRGTERSMSPHSALQAIKAKLHRFTEAPDSGAREWHSDACEVVERPPARRTEPEEDFGDVDKRLAALQQFLRAAKRSMDKT